MTETQDAIVLASSGGLSERIRLTKDELTVAAEQRRLLAEYVRTCMQVDVDYGVIPGTQKPTLLKPGAEKLVELFRCTPKFTQLLGEANFETGFFYYRFRVRLYSPDAERVLAEGYGSANSRESRYRWRDSKRKCPSCGKEAIIAGKAEYGGGWVCFKKQGGCGSKYKEDDKRILEQTVGRVENPDIADLDNTILKMAKKRALVDGAIALARCSDKFTQDVEDFMPQEHEPPPPATETAAKQSKQRKAPPATTPLPAKEGQDFAAAQERFGSEPPPPSDADLPPPSPEDFRQAEEAVHGKPHPHPLDVIPIGKKRGKRISTMFKPELEDIRDKTYDWLNGSTKAHKDRTTMEAIFHAVKARLDELDTPAQEAQP